MFCILGFCYLKFENTAVIDSATLDTFSILVGPWIVKCPGPEILSYDDTDDTLEVVMFVYSFVTQFWIVHAPHSISSALCQGKNLGMIMSP